MSLSDSDLSSHGGHKFFRQFSRDRKFLFSLEQLFGLWNFLFVYRENVAQS